MKIAFLSFDSGYAQRGAETFVDALAERLAKKHQVIVFQAGPTNKKPYLIRRIFFKAQPRLIFSFTLKALQEIKKEGFDLIIAVNGGWQTILARVYSYLSKTKLVVSGQAGIGWHDRLNLYCFPSVFVALSQRGFLWAKKINPFGKIVKIPNGVNLEEFSLQGPIAKLSLKPPVVICVAGLDEYKRVDETIKALARISASLLLIGKGSAKQEKFVDNLGKKILGKRYLRLVVVHQEIAPFYRAAELFTLVSQSYEAFGIAYLEAMACGLPIVATDDPLRREIVGPAGLFVMEPVNSDDYAGIIQKILKTDLKDIPRKQAEKFSWDKIAQQYEKLFLEIQ